MTDGNTAIQVSPVSEDAMTNVKQVFQQAVDAIVSASTLKVEVDQLREAVKQLQSQVDHYRVTIQNYDDQVVRLREERDAANARAFEAEDRLSTLTKTHNATLAELEGVRFHNETLRTDLSRVLQDRDAAELKIADLEEQLRHTTDKLAQIEQFARNIFPQPEPVPLTPVASVPQETQPEPSPWPSVVASQANNL